MSSTAVDPSTRSACSSLISVEEAMSNLGRFPVIVPSSSNPASGVIKIFRVAWGIIREMTVHQLNSLTNHEEHEELEKVVVIYKSQRTGLFSIQPFKAYQKQCGAVANIVPNEQGSLSLESAVPANHPAETDRIFGVFRYMFRSSPSLPSSPSLSSSPSIDLASPEFRRPINEHGKVTPLCYLSPDDRRGLFQQAYLSMASLPLAIGRNSVGRKSVLFSGLNGQEMYYFRFPNPDRVVLLFVYPQGNSSRELPPFGISIDERGQATSIENREDFLDLCQSLNTASISSSSRAAQDLTAANSTALQQSVILSQLDAVLQNANVFELLQAETQLQPLNSIALLRALTRFVSSSSGAAGGSASVSSGLINDLKVAVMSAESRRLETGLGRSSEISMSCYNPSVAEQDSFYTISIENSNGDVSLTCLKRSVRGSGRAAHSSRETKLIFPEGKNAIGIEVDKYDDFSSRFCDAPVIRSARRIMINFEGTNPALECYGKDSEMLFCVLFEEDESGVPIPMSHFHSHLAQFSLTAQQQTACLDYVCSCLTRVRSIVFSPNSFPGEAVDDVVSGLRLGGDSNISANLRIAIKIITV